MALAKRPLGFGTAGETARFFGIPKTDVLKKSQSGEWSSYIIGGRRVFDLDHIIDKLVDDGITGDSPDAP